MPNIRLYACSSFLPSLNVAFLCSLRTYLFTFQQRNACARRYLCVPEVELSTQWYAHEQQMAGYTYSGYMHLRQWTKEQHLDERA